ncbi:MAG: hypothetical protein GEV28_14780 [Actinophytocola sp.]|uniref:hypothetical protein n=1 Tax=Actinophytocola sp. TaxID=1872138 RepID=UPI001328AB87|nr:hypothetical protein [Actinophytocola sp.]MPZ81589.1 hypothetical protein [Actinophytocola sp.]
MRITRKVPWWAALMGLLAITLSGCDQLGGGVTAGGVEPTAVAGGGGGSSGSSGGGAGGCGSPGENVRQRLPVLDGSIEVVSRNPCAPFSGLAGDVGDLIPEPDRASATAKDFVHKVGRVAGQVAAAADLVDCLYRADQLAVQIYQHVDARWSVGVVVVVGISAEAAVDAASCYLFDEPQHDPGVDEPAFEPCLDGSTDGEYAVIKVGSTAEMCDALLSA